MGNEADWSKDRTVRRGKGAVDAIESCGGAAVDVEAGVGGLVELREAKLLGEVIPGVLESVREFPIIWVVGYCIGNLVNKIPISPSKVMDCGVDGDRGGELSKPEVRVARGKVTIQY